MTLPDPVHRQVLRWAGQTLGALPADRIPASLRRVAQFRASRRAIVGAVALAAAVDDDPGFRAAVAEHVRALGVDVAGPGDVIERAAAAHLWQHPDADDLLQQATSSAEVTALRQRLTALEATLEATLERERTQRAAGIAGATAGPVLDRDVSTESSPSNPAGAEAEAQRLRQRLREQGTALRAARLAAEEAQERATAELKTLRIAHERALAEIRTLRDRLDQEQGRADRAVEQAEYLRAADRAGREAAHRRIELLLDTVEDAGQGLRREWQLTTGGPNPADRVAGSLSDPSVAGQAVGLAALLALPHPHVVVDGYNVTKTGYPQLTLAEQRDRLARALSGLAARTRAEVTVVFDGAAVKVVQPLYRGVRVLYSPAGVTADDVIRQLVTAEPVGRVVIVVTADQEVLSGVQRAGARTVPPLSLLAALQADSR